MVGLQKEHGMTQIIGYIFGRVLRKLKLQPCTYCVKGTIDLGRVINPLLRT